MFQFLLNPWMLAGLLGIALPIAAHLLSRRRFDVVEWGAMQFLNPSRKTRRRVKLEELLLLLLRISLISLIVFAATRPVIPSGWFSGYSSAGSRTVVLLIDGSNSMSRSDGVNSVHQNAIRRSLEFLRTLGPDDNVALIDARDQPRTVIESPIRDLRVVEEQIRKLPPPGGSCAMLSAIEKAIGILGRSSSTAREIVVFADRQAQGWQTTREPEWLRVDEMLKFPAVRPQIWVIDVAPHLSPIHRNVSVGQIEMSREVSVPDFPIRLRVPVRNNSDQELQVPVRLMLDGQPLAGKQQTPSIAPHSETMLEFDHAIRAQGTHVLSVDAEIKDDAIAVDNVSHAAVSVAESLSVLLVNGTPSAAVMNRDTFFAELAFAPSEGKTPWVKTRVTDAIDLQPSDFDSVAVVIFCNVEDISPESAVALTEFVARGNGAIVACGPNTSPENFQHNFGDSGLLSQVEILRTREAPPQAEERIHVAPLSIQPGWLERFRSEPARSFLKATFSAWCLTKLNTAEAGRGFEQVPGTPSRAKKTSEKSTGSEPAEAEIDSRVQSTPIILAQLSTGDPLIVQSRCQNGYVLLITTTLNRQWTDLPTRSDYVPFLHEAVFHVASARSQRNVHFAEPLVMRMPTASPGTDLNGNTKERPSETPVVFTAPDGTETTITARPDAQALVAVYADTFAPGIYRSSTATPAEKNTDPAIDAFVVNYDHAEDDLTPLTADDKARLATNDRVRFSSSLDDLTKQMYGDESVTELWAVLMTMFLMFLITELLLTRRAIRKGYGGESLAAASPEVSDHIPGQPKTVP